MSTSVPALARLSPAHLPDIPAAAAEILAYLIVLAMGVLAFLLGWLTPNEAAVLTVLMLLFLLVLSWNRFNQGRHPCFLFLCTLMLFQGGRLIGYCLGVVPDPLRVNLMRSSPFDISRNDAGIVLLALTISAICVYAPCRWNYRQIAPPVAAGVRRYLPYLYLLFYGSLPVQAFKNYKYYDYAQTHGGYIYFWVNHRDFASSVPLWVRLISLITLPAFVAIFVFETRKKHLYIATACYFGSSLLLLLMGARMATFGLIVTLWYVAGIKSGKRSHVAKAILLGLLLLAAAGVFQSLREDSENLSTYALDPLKFVTLQGNSLDVTEVVVKYRGMFSPYIGSYLWNELKNGFVPHDYRHYFRGRELGQDISVLLNPSAFAQGYGTAGSYVAEEYLVCGVIGVIVVSLLIGGLLHLLYRMSQNPLCLFSVAMILPEFLGMPRGDLLDWLSVIFRTSLFVIFLVGGWYIYQQFLWPNQTAGTTAIAN